MSLLLLIFSCTAYVISQGETGSIVVVNNTDRTVCYVWLLPEGAEDSIERNSRILPAESQKFTIDHGIYDISVGDCNGFLTDRWQAVEVSETITLVSPSDFQRALELNHIGLQLWRNGQLQEALATFDEALQIAQEQGEISTAGTILGNMGVINYNQGQYEQALENFGRSLAIKTEVGDLYGEGTTLGNIAVVYSELGKSSEALDFFDQSLAISREINDQPGEFTALGNIGSIYFGQGRYSEALDFLNQALDIVYGLEDRFAEGQLLNNIGLIYSYQGQYTKALDIFNQSLLIRREVGDRVGEATSLQNIATVYISTNQLSQAYDYFTRSKLIAVEVGDPITEAGALIGLGGITDNYTEALEIYTQTLKIYQEAGARTKEGRMLATIGLLHTNNGHYTEALDVLQQALVILRQVGQRVSEADTLARIGFNHYYQRNYNLALDFYAQAIAIYREVGNRAFEGYMYFARANLYDHTGQLDNAILDYELAVDVSEEVLGTSSIDSVISGLTTLIQHSIPFQRLAVLHAVQHDLSLALDYAERGHAILTRNELTGNVIDFRADTDQSLLEHELELRFEVQGAQTYFDDLLQNNSSQENIIEAQDRLDSARSAYDRHLETMQLQGGYLAREISFQTATLEQIQSVIPDDTTLLIYSVADITLVNTVLPKSVVFLVTQGSLDTVLLDVTELEISDRVRAFNTGRQTGDGALRDLYDMAIAPIADQITTSNLIISPDQSLNYVPFAALFTEIDGKRHYLIDDYSIRMIPSGTTLWLLSQREKTTASANGLVMSQDQAPGLPPLPNAFEEVLKVSQLLDVEPIRDGTETQLRNNVSGNRILHISAHAELNRFAPLYSVIHLGGDDAHDGRLEIREIYELDLSQGTELVVLSGCETSTGGSGEDFGLMNRAFFATGAQEVVASLWVVDDRASADLLVSFIENRETYDDDAEALRQAMLTVREQHPEPYFWASFVINGVRN
jgi:CHAT domain-containing protein/Tfp pilus assembly protein PilF